jgi:Ca2+-binding RTX toxin-like protein
LNGGAGNDILAGGVYDTWNGNYNGAGNDTYQFGRGDGQDTLVDFDATAGNVDVLSVGVGVAANQLWFRQVGSDLEVSIVGGTDKSTISNWYSGSAYHVEQFKTSDGKMLLDSQVDALVSAMAAFAPPAAGQTTLPADYQTALNPVIAANWR